MTQDTGQAGSPKPYFTIEEVIALETYSSIDISGDGTQVAFVERVTDWDDNRYVEKVWTYDRGTRQRVLVTPDALGGSRPKWSSDGETLAYLRKVKTDGQEKPQLFVKSKSQAEGIQVTSVADGVGEYSFCADGSGIYYLSSQWDKSLKTRTDTYGDFEYVDVDYHRQTLYYVDVQHAVKEAQSRYVMPKDLRNASGRSSDAAFGEVTVTEVAPCFERPDLHVWGFDISRDGTKIVFAAAPSPNSEDFNKSSLYLFDPATKQVKEIDLPAASEEPANRGRNAEGASVTETGAKSGLLHGRIDSKGIFAPDGQRFVFTVQTGDGRPFRNNTIVIFDLQSGAAREVSTGIDERLNIVAWTDQGIVVEWQNRTNRSIERISENGQRTPVVTGEGVMASACSVTPDGQSAAYVQATLSSPTDVYVDGERITDLYLTFEARQVSTRRVVKWQSRDGSEVEGVLCLPQSFDENTKYPLLCVVHGGPMGASFPSPTQDKYYPIEQFIERGFIVLLPNYRGSTGYGEAFRSLNERNLGVGDYEDVISGVDYLVDAGYADRDKVGVMGWSQGGFISAFCTTYSKDFKAVSVGAGISNWVTYYVNTDIHTFTRNYLSATPWDDMEVYRRSSPMTYIQGADTPTLIQHGDKDSRVPLPNAFELYQGLKDVGAETQLVVFKGMQHGSDKPGWNRAIMHQNYAWFCHHVLGDEIDEFWL